MTLLASVLLCDWHLDAYVAVLDVAEEGERASRPWKSSGPIWIYRSVLSWNSPSRPWKKLYASAARSASQSPMLSFS